MELRVQRTCCIAVMAVSQALVSVICLTANVLLLATSHVSEGFGGFVEIAGGAFTMGADPARDPDAFDNERWSATSGEGIVSVPTFYIARYEVTTAEFAAFARANTWTVDRRALTGAPAHPVTFVSWPDALAYCRW